MTYTADAAALVEAYIHRGLPVLPLHWPQDGRCSCRKNDCRVLPDGTVVGSPAKHPLTKNGKDDATTDPGQVTEWLARWPQCNWGVRPTDSLIVVDVDPRNHGASTLARLTAENSALPETLAASTGGGGLHVWFSYRGPARARLCTGVDVKTAAGYVVAPPSRHMSGRPYRWLNDLTPAYLPQWMKTLLNPPRGPYIPRATRAADADGGDGITTLARFVAESTDGERNRRLFWAACRAHEKCLDPAPLVDAAIRVGLPPNAVAATVRSAARSPA